MTDRSSRQFLDDVLKSKPILWLKVIASLVGLTLNLVPGVEIGIVWVGRILVVAVVLSFAIPLTLKQSRHLGDRIAYAMAARKYGYGYEELTVKAYLEEPGGSMHVHRQVHLKSTSLVTHVRHYLHALSESTEGEMRITGCSAIEPKVLTVTAAKAQDIEYSDRMVIEVSFTPARGRGEIAVYEVREHFPPGSFATTTEQLSDRGLEWEFLSWHINKPTKHLQLSMFIPNSLGSVECEHDVWYAGYGQQRHGDEWMRLEPHLSQRDRDDGDYYATLQLDIPFPILGLVYVIKWRYS